MSRILPTCILSQNSRYVVLQRLVREGLVLVQPRKGYRVAPISLPDATDLFSYRQVLGCLCIRACKSASSDQLKSLDAFRRYKGKTDADF